jgi:cytochrome c-type biogenesis protein CcmH
MKDWKFVALFAAFGLAVAYFVASPLRKPEQGPNIGSPLNDDGLYAEGTVALDPSVSADSSAVVFIIAKPAAGGPPVAVKRFDYPHFPLQYSLSRQDNLAGDDFYDADIRVTARLDKDGIAGPAQPDDREASDVVKSKGNRHLDLTIREMTPASEKSAPVPRLETEGSNFAPGATSPVYAAGTITLGPGVTTSPGAVLFVIAKRGAGGPPVAVKRMEPVFPAKFVLTPSDNMIADGFVADDLQIIARLDVDGAAGPKGAGDREGTAQVSGKNRQVSITIVK